MKITQITVSYGATQSLPEYSNVKPNLTLTATLDEGDVPGEVEAELWAHVRSEVHAQIDLALEASGQPARYDPCERFQVLRTYRDHYARPGVDQPPLFVVIVPDGVKLDEETYGRRFLSVGYSSSSRNLRPGHAMQVAAEVVTQDGATLIDCSDGDLSRLAVVLPPAAPAIEEEQEHPF
jgi:hypothetical protein